MKNVSKSFDSVPSFFRNNDTAKSSGFLLGFTKRVFRAVFVPTDTHPFDEDKAREKDGCPFNELVMASGAKWYRNTQGNWCLFEPNRLENCAPVRELFEYFNLPCRVSVYGVGYDVCLVGQFATLHECGLAIDVSSHEPFV